MSIGFFGISKGHFDRFVWIHHDSAERYLDLPNQGLTVWAWLYVMVDLEVQVSVSVEDVFRCEVSDPVWIQIIVDHLSLSPEAPHCCGQIRLTSFEGTHGV